MIVPPKSAEDKHTPTCTGIRDMLICDQSPKERIAVIMTDPDNAAWIMSSTSFPDVLRMPRVGEMHLLRAIGPLYRRAFMGFFGTKEVPKSRRQESPPPPTEGTSKRRRVDGDAREEQAVYVKQEPDGADNVHLASV